MQEEKVMSNHERFHCEGEESDLEQVGEKTSFVWCEDNFRAKEGTAVNSDMIPKSLENTEAKKLWLEVTE